DAGVLLHQVPGGMISNLISQLKEQGALDKLKDVHEEIPRVRADLGYPPLVTPTSQIVGSQAVLNALFGERYKQVTKETRAYVLGQYGKSPAPISEEVRKLIAPGEEPITGRPADHLAPEMEQAAQELGDLARTEEDTVSYALFPPVVREYLQLQAQGDDLEPDLVAAIASALTHDHQPAQPEPRAAHQGGDRSPWKLAGRQRLLRG
ncbi:MAG: oxaloacetate decarboxylase subunit alpha, partial [Dehalococcoidia bacterium]